VADDRGADLALLGLDGDADEEKIASAYRHRAGLYHRDSLATYSLLSDEEREAKLARLAAAYHNLTGGAPSADGTVPTAAAEAPPDPAVAPGAFLRYARQASGMDLGQVSARTKIRAAVLEDLEAERVERLPAPVYVRGFVIQLARLFGVRDGDALAASYLARLSSGSPPG